ncbi:pheromone processing endoprotease [Massospora cicadina]|nr:pheromone processing endoprotease [Massospora cicadina]
MVTNQTDQPAINRTLVTAFTLFPPISPKPPPQSPHAHDYVNFVYFTAELNGLLAHEVAHQLGLEYLHQVGELTHHHLFRKPVFHVGSNLQRLKVAEEVLRGVSALTEPPGIWRRLIGWHRYDERLARGIMGVTLQEPKRLHRRHTLPNLSSPDERYNATIFRQLGIQDPGFKYQWHFHNVQGSHHDLNVTGLWQEGITGKGVVIAIVDDGIDFEHDDIRQNYFREGSFDFNKNRPDPYPDTELDTHGTRCAGQVAGIRNHVCGVGIAYGAKVAGIRILSLPIGDDAEAHAINFGYHINHVYSCSWGPPDDESSRTRSRGALEGRGGKGTVFVFASGNGGVKDDNCNFDGYTNSIYSITVGAIDFLDTHPEYSEACAALMISAYSSGPGYRRIYTSSSWNNACTQDHGGTSAAAPMVAGIIALALERRPDLTWRDFQHISVQSAVTFARDDSSWEPTWQGRPYSMKFGFGRVDGYRFVHHALNFKSVGPQVHYDTPSVRLNQPIPHGDRGLASTIAVTPASLATAHLRRLEHVTVTVDIQHECRSDLVIDLLSPNGILSHLAVPRSHDDSPDGFPNWTFMTVKHWDEPAGGNWTLRVYDLRNPRFTGRLNSWQMRLWANSKPTPLTQPETPTQVPIATGLPTPSEASAEDSTYPGLEEISKGYQPTHLVLFLLFSSGVLLVAVGVTFICHRRPSGYQPLHSNHEGEERGLLLNNIGSSLPAGAPPTHPSAADDGVSNVSEVLFQADELPPDASGDPGR